MLGVLPFVKDPVLSGSAAPELLQLLSPWMAADLITRDPAQYTKLRHMVEVYIWICDLGPHEICKTKWFQNLSGPRPLVKIYAKSHTVEMQL